MIEESSNILYEKGVQNKVIAKGFEKLGKVKFKPKELTRIMFEKIDKSSIILAELPEKGVRTGIGLG